jgi:uncharacterized DUF497 family protein
VETAGAKSEHRRLLLWSNEFEWHRLKAESNARKHGVTFEEAATIFEGDGAILEEDAEHSDEEIRFLLLGRSDVGNLLSVVHLERGSRLRIVSARPADDKERRQYDREGRIGI